MKSYSDIEFYLQLVINFLKEGVISHIYLVVISAAHISVLIE